ncbi:MAG: ABC transporter ATP-binding protein [candidate division KSB1 bacterium]|nr:ABC transporter ATP-binding protein [candidate division KSB1 bacterium]
MSDTNAMISLVGLSKSYGKQSAVEDLHLQVGRELFVFLGPNGAGKTTTIKLMTGLLRPDKGTILLDGVDVNRQPVEAKKRFGYAPETPALYEKLTPVEFIDFIIAVHRLDYKAALIRRDQLFEIFELDDHVGKLVEELSNGMKKKLSLIAALIHQPPILFLDEPTTALDPKAARNLKDLLRGIVAKGGCVFMSTHILEVAEAMCDRVGIIHKGRLIALGTVDELRRQFDADGSLEDIFLRLTGEPYADKVEEFLQLNG